LKKQTQGKQKGIWLWLHTRKLPDTQHCPEVV